MGWPVGGYGSGRRSGRYTVDEVQRIELPNLRQRGFIRPGHTTSGRLDWTLRGEPAGSALLTCTINPDGISQLVLEFTFGDQPVRQVIPLQGDPLPFGGHRWFAICQRTALRCRTLVKPPGAACFASVKGWGLAYTVTNEDALARAQRRVDKAMARLRIMSKYARHPTRQRQLQRVVEGDQVIEQAIAGFEARLWRAGS